jgi:simple sugar transport system ATP-binding protein
LILDETRLCADQHEWGRLFKIMHDLTNRGVSIVFHHHKLKEVLEVADRITVMRGGKVVGSTTPAEISEAELVNLMVGREVSLTVTRPPLSRKKRCWRFQTCACWTIWGRSRWITSLWTVQAGEILGVVAGVAGQRPDRVVRALTGLAPCIRRASIRLDGQEVANASPRAHHRTGVSAYSEDRQKDGCVLPFPVMDNLVLNTLFLPPFSQGLVVHWDRALENANQRI